MGQAAYKTVYPYVCWATDRPRNQQADWLANGHVGAREGTGPRLLSSQRHTRRYIIQNKFKRR
jgi:hypothetical protein